MDGCGIVMVHGCGLVEVAADECVHWDEMLVLDPTDLYNIE